MNRVKLTKQAQNIMNQVFESDLAIVSHGPKSIYCLSLYVELTGERVSFYDSSGDHEFEIANEIFNCAYIKDGTIKIDDENIPDNEYGDITINLYKFTKIAATN